MRHEPRDITPKSEGGFAAIARNVLEASKAKAGETDPAPAAKDGAAEKAVGDDASDMAGERADPEVADAIEIDPESPAYLMGYEAAKAGFLTVDHAPNKDDAWFSGNWIAGFKAAEAEMGADT